MQQVTPIEGADPHEQSDDEFTEKEQRNLVFVDTGVLDNLGLIAAFVSAISISLQATPSYEDLELADARCYNDTLGCAPGWQDENRLHYISRAHGFCSAITSSLSFMSCLLAIVSRSLVPMMADLNAKDRVSLAKMVKPLIILSITMLVLSLQTITMILYYHGQVTYQRDMAGGWAFIFTGWWFMFASFILSVYSGVAFHNARKRKKK